MKRLRVRPKLGSLAALVAASGLAALWCGACATTPLPGDPAQTCVLTTSDFNNWFQSGTAAANGVVNPANSVGFSNNPNCDFYKWAEQMFLWTSSPSPTLYGGGGRIFNSTVFYDVSPLDANGDRTLSGHSALNPVLQGNLGNLSLRTAQPGPHGLPVVISKQGVQFDVATPVLGPTGKQVVLNGGGEQVEIGRIELNAQRQPVFFDLAGKVIERPRPVFGRKVESNRTVAKFIVQRKGPIFLNSAGDVVEMEQGEADGSVLMSQTGSLVYYQTMVNDVYAYFLTGVKDNVITPGTQFPTTPGDLAQIVSFASAHGKPSFIDGNALAVELKTSWVEASTLPDASKYITMTATIPTYTPIPNATAPTELQATGGTKTVLMALVGIHVVGSTAGHAEMIWATFEHISNAPNAHYTYRATDHSIKAVDPNLTQAWLFSSANPSPGSINQPVLATDSNVPPNIVLVGSATQIGPGNIMRTAPWGAAPGVSPNPIDNTDSDSNSEIISINNSVRGMLPGDVRNNYILTSATWTINGGDPTPPPNILTSNFGQPGNVTVNTGVPVGTNQMANTTMETYVQPVAFSVQSGNCFSCHNTNTTSVSHVFFTPFTNNLHGIKPLF
jgi:hypothetical protein